MAARVPGLLHVVTERQKRVPAIGSRIDQVRDLVEMGQHPDALAARLAPNRKHRVSAALKIAGPGDAVSRQQAFLVQQLLDNRHPRPLGGLRRCGSRFECREITVGSFERDKSVEAREQVRCRIQRVLDCIDHTLYSSCLHLLSARPERR